MKLSGSNAWNTRGCEQEKLTSVNGECPSEKAAKAVSPKRQQRVEHAGLRTLEADIGQLRV